MHWLKILLIKRKKAGCALGLSLPVFVHLLVLFVGELLVLFLVAYGVDFLSRPLGWFHLLGFWLCFQVCDALFLHFSFSNEVVALVALVFVVVTAFDEFVAKCAIVFDFDVHSLVYVAEEVFVSAVRAFDESGRFHAFTSIAFMSFLTQAW